MKLSATRGLLRFRAQPTRAERLLCRRQRAASRLDRDALLMWIFCERDGGDLRGAGAVGEYDLDAVAGFMPLQHGAHRLWRPDSLPIELPHFIVLLEAGRVSGRGG